jgi:hypothetical protein
MQKIIDKNTVKVVFANDIAYWVMENRLYYAPVKGDGNIDTESAKIVDTFSLSEKEAKSLLEILDSIKED